MGSYFVNSQQTDMMKKRFEDYCFPVRTYRSPAPLLSLWVRVFIALTLMFIALWADFIWLLVGFSVALLFRFTCRLGISGLFFELIWMAVFSGMVTLVAATYLQASDMAMLFLVSFLRIAIALEPTLVVARTLLPREVSHAASGWVPGSLLLGLEMALRFVPQLALEAMEVFQIQKARGVFRRGSLLFRLRAMLLPFFIRLFRIADVSPFRCK